MLRYKVVLVPFPFDDLSSSKVRPAVCLTNSIGVYQHVVMSFITSKIPDDLLATDIVIDAADDDFAMTGLRVSSTLRTHRLMTTTTALISRELGALSPRLQTAVAASVRTLFELA
jgi:mRNA interferase MazF